ncbi:MAG: sulfite exporter TauE/SafE family protein [Acidobacteria bacterium]|nr:sulfite exporter TauE/SafE family protein [Acidobacteriota bacterium]
MMWFEAAVLVVSVLAGALAAVTGFGIGSLLTPLLALQVETRLAVAAISVPHVVGTALRFWLLSGGVDRNVFWSFGLTSAAGGLVGALLHGWASNRWLTLLFGGLLLFAAASEMTGLARRMRFRGHVAWIAGAVSGLLGGLVGNQGGLRSAALLGFDLSKKSFVATATAVGLVVDGARMPVYIATQHREMSTMGVAIAIATVGVVIGTLLGSRVLSRIPDIWFHRVLAVVLAGLGTAMMVRGLSQS